MFTKAFPNNTKMPENANLDVRAKYLQNTPQLICISLNNNNFYYVMPRSTKYSTDVNEVVGSCGVFCDCSS